MSQFSHIWIKLNIQLALPTTYLCKCGKELNAQIAGFALLVTMSLTRRRQRAERRKTCSFSLCFLSIIYHNNILINTVYSSIFPRILVGWSPQQPSFLLLFDSFFSHKPPKLFSFFPCPFLGFQNFNPIRNEVLPFHQRRYQRGGGRKRRHFQVIEGIVGSFKECGIE